MKNLFEYFRDKERALLIPALLLLTALRFALSLYYPVFSDANMYFYQAKRIAENPSLLINPEIAYFPPLLFIIGAFMHTLLGEIGLKLIAPFFGAVGIYYTYRLGKEVFDEKAGLLGAVFLGIIPSHIYLSSMGYMDSMVTGLSISFVYYFYKAMNANETNNSFVYAGILAGLAAISKLTGLVVFPFIAVYFLILLIFNQKKTTSIKESLTNIKHPLKISLYTFIVGMAISTPYYLRNWILFKNPLFPQGGESIHFSRSFDMNVFDTSYSAQMEVAYRSSYLGGVNIFDYIKEIFYDFWGLPMGSLRIISFIPSYVIALFVIFCIIMSLFYFAGVFAGVKEKQNRVLYIWLLTWSLMLLVLGLVLIWGFRRLLPVAPFLALLAGYQFNRIDGALLKKFACLLLILSVIAFPSTQIGKAWYAKSWFDTYSDSLEYLRTLPEDSIVLTPYEEQTIYYSEKKTMLLNNLRPDAFNLTTLGQYGITHVVRTESFIFFNLSEHNNAIDKMARNGDLSLLWESRYVKIYKVK